MLLPPPHFSFLPVHMDCHTCSVDISRSEAVGIRLFSFESRRKHVESLEKDGGRETKPGPWREAPSKHRRPAPIHPSPAPSPPHPHKLHLHTPQHHYLHSHSIPHLSHTHHALPPAPPPRTALRRRCAPESRSEEVGAETVECCEEPTAGGESCEAKEAEEEEAAGT